MLAVVLGQARESRADDPAPAATLGPPTTATPATPHVRLHYNLLIDAPLTGVLAASLVVWGVAIKPNLGVPSCTICDGDDRKVNAVDDFFRSNLKRAPSSSAGSISDVFAYGLAPATGISLAVIVPAYDRRIDEAPLDLLLVTEAALTFAVIQQGLTALFPRERPAVHAAEGEARANALTHHSSFESFPAGHNGSAWAIASAGGTIATMRGYRLAPVVWIVGGGLAFMTSYLRIAADRHYFTDISIGGGLGVATGVLVPLLFHGPAKDRPSAMQRWLQGTMVSTTDVPGGRIVSVGRVF